jgi:hypothetical protein
MARPQNPFQMGQFKFGLIAPVIQGTYSDKTPAAYYRRVSETPLARPDGSVFSYKPNSLRNWERLYRKGVIPTSKKSKPFMQNCIKRANLHEMVWI